MSNEPIISEGNRSMTFADENKDGAPLFADESTSSKPLMALQGTVSKPVTIMIIDDEKEVHDVTRMVLSDYTFEGRAINFLSAYSAAEAKVIMSENNDIALILLDVVMEKDDSGLKLVQYIRESLNNKMVRIILRTGQPGQAPEQEVISNYDINDYKSKTELTIQKLYTTITSSLRSYRDLKTIEHHRIEIEAKSRLNKQLLDSLPFATLLLESNGDVVACNQAAIDSGIKLNTNCISAPSGSAPCPWGPLPIDLEREKTQQWEKEFNGKYYDIHWTPLDKKQALYYAFDITDARVAENEKKRYQKLFQQAQKMESIGMLASGIAHDFNNILTVVNGYAEILTFSLAEDDGNIVNAKAILDAGKSGAKLAKKLLSLSRKDKDEFNVLDIHKVIADTVRLLTPNCKKIKLSSELMADTSLVLGEENQLQNALINLGVNARDAMPGGGNITYITSIAKMTDEDVKNYPQKISAGNYIQVKVTDSGSGIEPDTMEKIFEPLFTTKEPGKGTGLGLASVYSCVENHKGIINVDSILGQGTTFTILLPLKK